MLSGTQKCCKVKPKSEISLLYSSLMSRIMTMQELQAAGKTLQVYDLFRHKSLFCRHTMAHMFTYGLVWSRMGMWYDGFTFNTLDFNLQIRLTAVRAEKTSFDISTPTWYGSLTTSKQKICSVFPQVNQKKETTYFPGTFQLGRFALSGTTAGFEGLTCWHCPRLHRWLGGNWK